MSGRHFRLLCRCGDCSWSRDVAVAADADTRSELLVILRAHADSYTHGRTIEGIAVGTSLNGDVEILTLRHP